MAFVLPYFEFSGTTDGLLEKWFEQIGKSTRKARLHGYRLWKAFCEENEIDLEYIRQTPNPAIVVARFIANLDDTGVHEHMCREASVAVRELIQLVRADAKAFFDGCTMLKTITDGLAKGVRRTSKYREIWKLSILLDHIRNGPPSEQLPWRALMARTAALFMIFVPCRPITMIRMDCTRERWAPDGQSVEIPAKEKMDKGRRVTAMVIRSLQDKRICPLTHYNLLKEEASIRQLTDCIWGSEYGKAYTTSSGICHLLKLLLGEAGIPSEYAAYSIRHATITALIEAGLSEVQVNAYTGHSNNAHTVATSYYHLNRAWAGSTLASGAKVVTMKPEAIRVIDTDNQVNLIDEGIVADEDSSE